MQSLHLGALKTDLWIEHFLSQRALEHVITAELMQTEIAQTVDVLRDAFETRVGSEDAALVTHPGDFNQIFVRVPVPNEQRVVGNLAQVHEDGFKS